MSNPQLYVIAGSNGSGKTTFANQFLKHYVNRPHFVNADLIAQGLSPFAPNIVAIKAGRLFLQEIQELLDQRKSFAFETTLSGRTYVDFFKKAKHADYQIHIFFLWIPSPLLAIGRIKDRVAKGGHSIPSIDIRRRFFRSLENFRSLYLPLVDSWHLFNNASRTPELVAKMENGKPEILKPMLYKKILNM